MKIRTLILAGVLTACSLAAHADSSGNSRCYWERGVFVCTSSYETPYSKTTTLCGSGVTSACTTKTIDKEQPKPEPAVTEPPANEWVPFNAAALERARERTAAKEWWPAGAFEVCKTDHWQKDHWEPSCSLVR